MKEAAQKVFHWEPEFRRNLIRVALPIALQNLVTASAHIVDGLMVAGLGNAHFAAVTQAGRYSFLFQLFLFGAASGSSIFISQFWGKRDEAGIHKVMSLCLRITEGLAVLFCLGAMLFPQWIMGNFLPEGQSRQLGAEYLSWVGLSYLFAGIDIIYANTLRAAGRASVAMGAGIISILTNTGLNYLLIYGHWGFPALGIRGAAIATCLSAAVGMLIDVAYTYWKHQPGAIKLRQLKMPDRPFSLGYIKRVMPVVLNEGLWSLGVTTYAAFYGRLGDDAVNAVGVYQNIEQLMTVFVFGVVSATAILIGHAIGAGRREEAMLISKRMLLATEVMSAATGLLLIVLRYPIMGCFGKLSEGALQNAGRILLIAGLLLPIRYFNTLNIVGVLRGGGDTVFSMVLDAGMVWAVGVPSVALAVMVWKLPITGVFLITYLEDFFKMLLGLPRFYSGKWIHNLTNIGTREA